MDHPLLQSYGPLDGWHILLLIGGLSIGFFLYQVQKAARLVMLGAPDDRFGSWRARLSEFISGWLGQKRVLRDRFVGSMHVLMFWGFLMLASDMFDLATANTFSDKILPDALFGPWNGMVELGYTMAFIGCVPALIRRVVFAPEKLEHESQLEGNIILFLIFSITTTSFIVESFHDPSSKWEPIGHWVGGMGLADGTVVAAYWIHMLSICIFFVLIPLSKHMHLVMAVPNVFFHDIEPKGKMRPLAVGDDGKAVPMEKILEIDPDDLGLGASTYTDYTWRQLIDGWSCTSCARCQDVCPAYASGKGLNPMQVIHDVRNYANEHAPLLLSGGQPEETMMQRITDEAVWACTTCNACVDVCPLYIEHVPKLTDLRRNAVMETMEYPDQLNVAFDNLDSTSNPYGFGSHERADWAADLDVKVGEPAEYIYFVGCAASFDERNQKVARSTISLLKEAGLDVGILGMQEGCSGDPARRAGNEFLFQMLAETNMMTFQELGVKRIVASCPHCFHTLGKEYGDYGGDELEVFHHSEILAKLQEEGKLPQVENNDRSVTFHDPCYLGRHNGIYDEPREILRRIPGVELVEMPDSRENSLCCGGGGGRIWMDTPKGERFSDLRVDQAVGVGAGVLATSCPYCITNFEDSRLALDDSDALRIKDITEILQEVI